MATIFHDDGNGNCWIISRRISNKQGMIAVPFRDGASVVLLILLDTNYLGRSSLGSNRIRTVSASTGSGAAWLHHPDHACAHDINVLLLQLYFIHINHWLGMADTSEVILNARN